MAHDSVEDSGKARRREWKKSFVHLIRVETGTALLPGNIAAKDAFGFISMSDKGLMTTVKEDKQGLEYEDISSIEKRARRIRDSLSTTASASKEDNREMSITESLREIHENISWFRRLVIHSRQVISGLYQILFAPVWGVVSPPLRWLGRKYAVIWKRFAFTHDKTSGPSVLSTSRSSVLVVITVLSLSVFTNTRLGETVRFFTVEPAVDGVMIAFSLRTESFFLSQTEEIDSASNTYSVRGCRTRGECSESDAAYFRVSPRLSHDVWKLFTHGNPIYVPDHAVSPIAPGLNECRVTYYGYRMTSSWIARVLRSLQVYPTMLEASCIFLGAHP